MRKFICLAILRSAVAEPGSYRNGRKSRRNYAFDSTLGFPGEGWSESQGWSSKFRNLRIATWNCRSLTKNRISYCESLRYDVLVLTELWRNQSKHQRKDRSFTISEPILIKKGPRKGQKRFPDDRAAGVAILLSDTAEKQVESFGSEGERVCWVRLRGPICHLFIIGVYMPHRARTTPKQGDTMHDLEKVLSCVPQGDCICVAGDFNEQLPACTAGRTDEYAPRIPDPDCNPNCKHNANPRVPKH